MTNEQAKEIMKAYRDRLTSSCSNQLDSDIEAFNLAIEALEDIEEWDRLIPICANEGIFVYKVKED